MSPPNTLHVTFRRTRRLNIAGYVWKCVEPMCSWMSYEALPAFDDESHAVVHSGEKNLSMPGPNVTP